MAHRLFSHHRTFFSPRNLTGISSYISTTAATNFEVKDYFEFTEKVLESKKPVVVDFHAEWCAPCKLLAPTLDAVIERTQGAVELAKVNIDSNAELAMQYGVSAIPTLVTFRDGQQVDKTVGMISEKELEDVVAKLTNPK